MQQCFIMLPDWLLGVDLKTKLIRRWKKASYGNKIQSTPVNSYPDDSVLRLLRIYLKPPFRGDLLIRISHCSKFFNRPLSIRIRRIQLYVHGRISEVHRNKKFHYCNQCIVQDIRHRGEAVLRKHLRTFEENQISNIIRKTKGKRRLKFHPFYSAKKYPKGYA